MSLWLWVDYSTNMSQQVGSMSGRRFCHLKLEKMFDWYTTVKDLVSKQTLLHTSLESKCKKNQHFISCLWQKPVKINKSIQVKKANQFERKCFQLKMWVICSNHDMNDASGDRLNSYHSIVTVMMITNR